MQKEFDIDVDWRGFELHPETPSPGVPITSYFPAQRIEGMRSHLRKFAGDFGITDLRFPETLPNTRRVLALTEYARDMGKLQPFREIAMNLYWREGRDLGDEGELRRLSTMAGLDPDAAMSAMHHDEYLARVDALREEATERGVTGIPTFFFGETRVVGCQAYEVLAHAAQKAGAQPKGDQHHSRGGLA